MQVLREQMEELTHVLWRKILKYQKERVKHYLSSKTVANMLIPRETIRGNMYCKLELGRNVFI